MREGARMSERLVEMRAIEKSFNGIKVNEDVNFTLMRGEIHSLLGENGAGKTTLMNILYGLYQSDKGEIYFEGQRVEITDPLKAISYGVGMVHQHFMLVEPLSVYENIVLGAEESRLGFLRREESQKKIEQIMESSGLHVDLNAKVHTLPIGVKQRVEILKVLYRGAKVLILDEPTAVLTPQETDELFVTLCRLRDAGTSIILITHKMRETFMVSDRITIMRRGKIVADFDTDKTNAEELAQHMVGRNVNLAGYDHDQQIGEVVLKLEDVKTDQKDAMNLEGVSFEIRRGEIFGVAGVDGNGQSQLSDLLIGVIHPSGGQVFLEQADITRNTPFKQGQAGIAVIPEDRNAMGLIADFSVTENIMLGKQRLDKAQRRGFIRRRDMERQADEYIEKYSISPPRRDLPAKGFSGGNQQKIIIARELEGENIKLVLAVQPTRGLDIGATEFVHRQLIKMRDEGKAVLLISTELDEIRTLSDRIGVLYEGKMLDVRAADEYTEQQIGLLMAGKVG